MRMASTPNKTSVTSVNKSSKSPKRSPQPQSKAQDKKKSQSSMGLGLLMIAIGTSLVGLGGLGYLFYQELLGSSQREIDRASESQARQIEGKLANVRQSVEPVANIAKSLALQTPKPKTAEPYQRLVLESLQSSEAIAGMGIVQNENLLFVSPKPVVPYVWKEQSGLKPEVAGQKLAAPNDKLLAASRPDISANPAYKTAIAKGKASWSEPYNVSGKSVISYFAPIGDPAKPMGMVQADAIANNILAIAATPNGGSNGESKIGFVVVSSSGKVITASDAFASAQAQNPAITESLNTLAQQSKAQPTGITQSGGNLWAYRKIEGSELLVATYLPESEITNKLMVLVGGAALGISAILAIAILGFVNSLKKRLQPLTEECDRFLTEQGAESTKIGGKDEIEHLSLSLKNTFQKVKTNEFRLRNELAQNSDSSEVAAQVQQSFAETELMEAEVGDLLDVVSYMEEGDLTIEAQVNDRATGLVADTLNRLREKLIEIISSVLGTAQQVVQGASDLEELARTVVLNTAEQAESVAQGQALTEQVAAIATRSADQVNIANQSLKEVRDTVASGQTAINTLTDSIVVLQTGSAQIVQRMKTLGEFVGLAEQFVQDQGQIASLTQVLALNATLVAARAAEQKDPKQFAGVAREFESIAGQVNDLATQTNDGLTTLQQRTSQIQTVVTAIDVEVQNLSGLVAGFTSGVEDSQSAFNSIQIATEEVVQIGLTITKSSTEIADAAGSTASYISEIAQLADRTANLTRSARQQAEAMGYQAQQLLEGIQFFRLPEASAPVYAPAYTESTYTEPDASINSFVDYSSPETNNLDTDLDANLESNEDRATDGLGLVVPAIGVAAATFAVSQSGQSNSTEFTNPDLDLGAVQDQDFILDSDDVGSDSLISDNLISDSLTSDSLISDSPVQDDFVTDNLVTEDFATDDFVLDNPLSDNFVSDNPFADDFVLDDLVPDSLVPDGLVPDSLVPDGLVPDGLVPDSLVTDSLVPDDFVLDDFALDNLVPNNLISEDESTSIFLDTNHDEPDESYSSLTDISAIEESLFADLKHETYAEDTFDENSVDYPNYVENPEEFLSVGSVDNETILKNPLDGVDELTVNEASSDPIVASATSSFLEDTTLGNPSLLPEEVLSSLPTSFDFSVPDLDYIDYNDDTFEAPATTLESPLDEINSFFDADLDQQVGETDLGFDVFNPEQPEIDSSEIAATEYGEYTDDYTGVYTDDYTGVYTDEQPINNDYSNDYAVDEIAETDDQFDDPFENLDLSQTAYVTGLSGFGVGNSSSNSDISDNLVDGSDLNQNVNEFGDEAEDSILGMSELGVSELLELPIDSSETFSFDVEEDMLDNSTSSDESASFFDRDFDTDFTNADSAQGFNEEEIADEVAAIANPLINPLDEIYGDEISPTETYFPSMFDAVNFDEDESSDEYDDEFSWQSETVNENLTADLTANELDSPETEELDFELPDFIAIADSEELEPTESTELPNDNDVDFSVGLSDLPEMGDSALYLSDISSTPEANTPEPLNETETFMESDFNLDLLDGVDEDSDEFDAFQEPIEEVSFDPFDSLLGDDLGDVEEFNQPDAFSEVSVIDTDDSILNIDTDDSILNTDGFDTDRFTEAIAPDFTPDIEPAITSGIAPVFEPDIAPDFTPDFELGISSDIAPDFAPDSELGISSDIAPDFAPDFAPDITPDTELSNLSKIWESSGIDQEDELDYEDSAIFGVVSTSLEDLPTPETREEYSDDDSAIFDSLASDLDDYSLENYSLDDSGTDLDLPTNSFEDAFESTTFNIENSNIDSNINFNTDISASDIEFSDFTPDINDLQDESLMESESTEDTPDFSIDLSDDWLMGIVEEETDSEDDFSAIAEFVADQPSDSSYGFTDDLLNSLMDESDENDLSMDLPEISMDSSWLPAPVKPESGANESDNVPPTPNDKLAKDHAVKKQDETTSESKFSFDFSESNDPVNPLVSLAKEPVAKVKAARDEIEDFLSGNFDLDEPV
jgi:twitching motility protein PilJ